jgi:lambda family phage portal protein
MIGECLDSAISIFSPATAAKRAYARSVYKRQTKRAYEAARIDRTTAPWVANSLSADRALYGEADRVRNRVRDLVRNNAYARGALDAIVANAVGCGITPKPAIKDNQPANDAILEAWNRWCESADITGRLHFYEMQALALRECVEAGEMLLNKIDLQPDPVGGVPFALELIEAERIASETDVFRGRANSANQAMIRRGVEVDATGKAVAYWLYPTNPNDLNQLGVYEAQRTSADTILHLYRQERIGQTRGISWLAPAVLRLRDLEMYLENELQASAVAACFAVAIKTVDSGNSWGDLNTPEGQDSTDGNDDKLERLQPGIVSHLMPGEDISVINPMRPNAAADAFLAVMLRSIGVACGLSYELVSRDYSRANYSSIRTGSLEDQRRFRPMQKFLIWRLCQPVYRAWFRQAVLAKEAGQTGLDAFPSLAEYIEAPEEWTRCNWRAPGWEWVDPLKDVQAAAIEVKEGFRSRGDIIEANGGDLRETFTELSQENDLAEELGLTLGDQAAALQLAETNNENKPEPAAAE